MPTIGVFDSGFGGLTVLRALLPLIPYAHYIYLGDTARLPYGAKSQSTIARYAVESARFLESQGCDHLVIACNTATALALPEIRTAVSIPVTGVVEPGAQAAHDALHDRVPRVRTLGPGPATPSEAPPQILVLTTAAEALQDNHDRVPRVRTLGPGPATPSEAPPQILVLATAATVASHAYRTACDSLHLHATELATPLLVPLIEEGWTTHPVTDEVLRIYLTEALTLCTPDAVILGCTHYPLIAPAIEQTLRTLGSPARIIDSAHATAQAVAATLNITTPATTQAPATFTCYATDSIEKFQRLGSHFLGQPIPSVNLLDLGG